MAGAEIIVARIALYYVKGNYHHSRACSIVDAYVAEYHDTLSREDMGTLLEASRSTTMASTTG